jgi:hypothetical protein
MIWTEAATGMASRAPRIPWSDAPAAPDLADPPAGLVLAVVLIRHSTEDRAGRVRIADHDAGQRARSRDLAWEERELPSESAPNPGGGADADELDPADQPLT